MTTNDNSLDIHEVIKHLPHRYPFLLVDRVVTYEAGKSLVALKNVTINEPFFPGHFPHRPVMPGVLIIEALAQATAILSFVTNGTLPDENSVYYFAGIEKARFRRPVEPGDQLMLEVELVRRRRNLLWFKGRAMVDGKVAAEAEMSAVQADIS
jgi:3-hydroxyacyl-[acyl-carrier-protein] dehydratase